MSDDAKPDLGAARPAALDLGRYAAFGMGFTPEQAAEIEALGYGAVWVAGSPPAELDWVEPILAATTTLQVATGIVNIWSAPAEAVATSFHRIDHAHPGRFLLGIGVGHPEADQTYRKPWTPSTSTSTSSTPTGARRPPGDRRSRTAGAEAVGPPQRRRPSRARHPEHTAQARDLIGPDAFLAPAVPVVPTPDVERARAVGRQMLEIYLGLQNYLNNWKRLGFTDDDIARPGSDRLVDALLVSGTRTSSPAGSGRTSMPAPTTCRSAADPTGPGGARTGRTRGPARAELIGRDVDDR